MQEALWVKAENYNCIAVSRIKEHIIYFNFVICVRISFHFVSLSFLDLYFIL